MKKEGVQLFLTAEEAMSVLPEKQDIHTFINVAFSLVGADIDKSELEYKLMKADYIEVCGEQARSLGHGICFYNKSALYQSDVIFVETDEEKLKALESEGE